MWPFQGSKSKTGVGGIEKYFEHTSDDEQLKLSPARVKSLKKTLFYQCDQYCEIQDFDIFTVCWDVSLLSEPPDDIAPLLPPATWGEPDIICIGLQRCNEEAATSWSVVFSQSIAAYSPSYIPLSAEAPYDPNAGCLLLVYMRSELHHLVHSYAHEDRGVAAVRFGFHQSSVCIVTLPSLFEPEQSSFGGELSKAEKQQASLNRMALRRQRFRSLTESIQFSGTSCTLDNHPFIIWLGAKDEKLHQEREMERVSHELLTKDKTDAPPFVPSCEPLPRLNDHNIDVRYRHRSFIPFDAAALPFATPESSMSQPHRGKVSVLKAGTMRLVLELLDDAGQPVPCESSSELVLLRMSIPMVDVEKLKSLYQQTWQLLKDAPVDEYPSIIVDRPSIKLAEPIVPWAPTLFRFKIRNICKWRLPASYSLYCVSDSGNYVIPLARHSFHYNALSNAKKDPPLKGHKQHKGKSSDGRIPAIQFKSISSKLSSKSLLPGSMTARSNFGGNFLSRVLGSKKSKSSGSKTVRDVVLDSELEEESVLTETPRSSTNQLVTPRNTGGSTPLITPRKMIPSFSLTKWISANPMEGVVMGDKEIEVAVSLMLMEGVSTHCRCDPLTLVVRIDDCKRDVFVSVDPVVIPSIFGLSPTDLLQLGEDALLPPSSDDSEAPTRSPPPDLALSQQSTAPLPLPKEIWNLFKFIHHSMIRCLDHTDTSLPRSWLTEENLKVPARWWSLPVILKDAAFSWTLAHCTVRTEMQVIVRALETNQQIPPTCSVEAALRVFEKWCLAMPLPFVPRESLVNAEQEDHNAHVVCRAVLLNLSTITRNIFMALMSITRELIVFNTLTHEHMMPFLSGKLDELHCSDMLPDSVTLERVLPSQMKTKLLQLLKEGSTTYSPPQSAPEITAVLVEWLGRFIATDSPRELRNFFVSHFLN